MSMPSVERILAQAIGSRILCVGDIMLDRYVYGDVKRISPEAPIPILHTVREKEMLGAVGNVARNISALGGKAHIVGLTGNDPAAETLAKLVGQCVGVTAGLVTEDGRQTVVKTRFVSDGQQLLRVDYEDTFLLSPLSVALACTAIEQQGPTSSVILVSDYAKGFLNDQVLTALHQVRLASGVRIVVDPKGADFGRYGTVDVLKPNAAELSAALGGHPTRTDAEIEQALGLGLASWPVAAIVVTRSAKGISFQQRGGIVHHVPGRALEVFDVSGAGDTVLAALGLALGTKAELADAVEFAVTASSVAVAKAGTSVVTPYEVREAYNRASPTISTLSKVMNAAEAQLRCSNWRDQGQKIGFTNGCFDIMHAGHIETLEFARAQCDRLIVGLNSDASVKRLKGETRPVNDEAQRARVLAGLSCVDAVVTFTEDTPLSLITHILPDVLVKGGDYNPDTLVGSDIVRQNGGKVIVSRFVDGQSTTSILERAGR